MYNKINKNHQIPFEQGDFPYNPLFQRGIKRVLTVTVIFLISTIFFAFGSEYVFDPAKIKEDRKEKDEYFRTANDSPIQKELRKKFKGLKYFPPTKEFVFNALLEKYSIADTVKMKTSKKEKTRWMLKYGKLNFTYKSQKFSLNAYLVLPLQKENELFVPFTDKTTGNLTYEAGRYIDLPFSVEKKDYLLDFNQAYNPYCAYNKNYSCPLVPLENNLQISIKAGERVYKKE